MPNWPQMLFQSWFPKLSKRRQGMEEISHSWLTLLAWTQGGSLLRNGTWTPLSPGAECCRCGRKHPQLQICGKEKIAQKLRNLRYISSHKSNKGNCKQHIIFLCIFELFREPYLYNIIYFAYCPHPTELESDVLLSPKPTNKARGKTLLPLYFLFFLSIPVKF